MSEEKNEENINEPESLYFINDELKIYNSFEKQNVFVGHLPAFQKNYKFSIHHL